MISIIQALFSSKSGPIWVSKKRNNQEFMICLMPKSSQKISELIEDFYGFHQSQTLFPLITLYGEF